MGGWTKKHSIIEWKNQNSFNINQMIKNKSHFLLYSYSETLNNEYIEKIHQMSYSSLSDNRMLQIFSFLIKWLYGTL